MNEHELTRRRWSRCEDALQRAAGDAGRRVEELVVEIIANMREREEAGEAGNVLPDPRLVDELVAAATRRRMLFEHVLPLYEKLQRNATTYNPDPAHLVLQAQAARNQVQQ